MGVTIQVTIHAMDITQTPWKIETLTLACVYHPSPHDAERNLAKIEQVLSGWGIPLEVLMCSNARYNRKFDQRF